ncbi:phospholipase D-like domain-containing protein [Gelidibacter gilvus]|uniref:Phospholipase D-like domain-containing protein n=1 Tax=Gelidibacter gilvus TaxID=59602 RepID=A0A4Q0XH26_9FLAO|nr:phospholipase D-like domain-containing protein [Gelidibacter gilvus]RXJ49607.1 hypothetical protein ESZ48_11400 [Gelidibacter gilvus]
MPFKAFFDGPNNYKKRFCFYEQGGSPFLLEKFIAILEAQKEDIEEINMSWYLYNNRFLHDYLKALSKNGIKVNVITIPLEGYDHSKPQVLEDLITGERRKKSVTKYDLAKDIFAEMYHSKAYPNFNIYFFPHLYVRSPLVNKFSRGALPYSLHVKSAYIKKKTGSIIVLSSSNLAVRDLVKYESMICIQDETAYEDAFQSFYSDLIRNSITIKDYKKSYNTICNTFEAIDFKNADSSFITAPFYKNSANLLDKTLTDYIRSAKERIIICAQHLAAFNYEFNAKYHSTITESETRQGILGAVIAMANKGVHVTCLSQTFAPSADEAKNFEGIAFRKPLNTNNFQQFYAQLALTENVEYFVNEHLHSKFIIIDNKLIYCTYNFTPTQFIYLDKVKISRFKNMPDLSYEGIHCEVGMHVIIENERILKLFEEHIAMIKNESDTIQVK